MHFSSTLLAQAALSLLTFTPLVSEAAVVTRQAPSCNGQSSFCDRSYGNISFVGAHDSYSIGQSIANNQDQSITTQLNDGVRMLQMQAHNGSDGQIHLCHTSCLLFDGGTLANYLTTVKTWMDANPNDVVTLLIVNSDDLAPTAYASVFSSVGLDKLAYSPSNASLTNEAWPTLGSMISAGTRLVVFMDFKADFTSVPYIISEFTSMWETAFDVTTTTFDCSVNRTQGNAASQLYLINHFLDEEVNEFGISAPAPNKNEANVTNGVSGTGSLGLQADQCGAEYGRYPNFMLVDFYEFGNGSVFQVAASLNGVTYNPSTPVAQPVTSSSTSSSSTSTSTSGALLISARHSSGLLAASLAIVTGVVLGAWSVV